MSFRKAVVLRVRLLPYFMLVFNVFKKVSQTPLLPPLSGNTLLVCTQIMIKLN